MEGFRSIRRVDLDLTTDVTVLIGANGSGKSNLVSALELVSRIWDDSFQEYLRRRGGVDNLLFEDDEGTAERILIEMMSEFDEGNCRNGYRVTLREDDWDESGQSQLHEWLLFQAGRNRDKPYDENLGSGTRSRVPRFAQPEASGRLHNFAAYVRPILEGCRVFHFDDVSSNAPVKGRSTVGDDITLRSDAENIAAYLLRVRDEHPQHYRRIVSAIRRVTPFFDDFVLVDCFKTQIISFFSFTVNSYSLNKLTISSSPSSRPFKISKGVPKISASFSTVSSFGFLPPFSHLAYGACATPNFSATFN